jgi:hypothetical protein
MLHLKARSEDYILHKLSDEVNILSGHIKDFYEQQLLKAEINRAIVRGIKEQGHKYADELPGQKQKLIDLISQQEQLMKIISREITHLQHLLNLLIHMEQVSLAIHAGIKQDDLSDMVDVHTMPLEKFRNEVEHLKMITSSFDILKVELTKQRDYVNAFDLDPNTFDEHYFYESEKYESKLAEEEIVNVSQLREFCTDLSKMIHQRMGGHAPATESDKAVQLITMELKRIKLSRSFFFPLSIHSFIRKLVARNVRAGHLQELIAFLIQFLLSRLKKFKMSAYYAELRATILVYHIARHLESGQRSAVTGAALLANLSELNFPLEKIEDDEQQIVRNYYLTVNQIFDEEFTFVNRIISQYHKSEEDGPALPWVVEGGCMISLCYDFDAELEKLHFNRDEVSKGRDAIRSALLAKHPGSEAQIADLFSIWSTLIPRELALLT